ncbi:MAG: DUF1460 domain-containing protein [Culturomica sp.]|jgi:hypothetical protein|nr:DUF1460 domain-containing protein [Culturomica sp.]
MKILLVTVLLWCCAPAQAAVISPADSAAFRMFCVYAKRYGLEQMPVQKRIPVIARFFLGRPYKSGTLNVPDTAKPVINLRETDCVTLVENILALAWLPKYREESLSRFVRNIVRVRYRNGEITDYASRLHYSTDWLYEMQRQHLLKDITQKTGGVKFPHRIGYMSENYRNYPQLAADTLTLLPRIRAVEAEINRRTYYYIPKDSIRKIESRIEPGDIVLITTNIAGLDTSHLGIAYEKDGRIHLLHASSDARRVVVSKETLGAYTQTIGSQTGIMIARALPLLGEEWIALPGK